MTAFDRWCTTRRVRAKHQILDFILISTCGTPDTSKEANVESFAHFLTDFLFSSYSCLILFPFFSQHSYSKCHALPESDLGGMDGADVSIKCFRALLPFLFVLQIVNPCHSCYDSLGTCSIYLAPKFFKGLSSPLFRPL